MSKFEKFGSIKFSPTAVTDKEEVHGLHKRAEGSASGGGLFVCNITMAGETFLCDRTTAEMYEAFDVGRVVVCVFGEVVLWGTSIFEDGCGFTGIDSGYSYRVSISDDGSVEIRQYILVNQSEFESAISQLTSRIEALEAAAQTTTE